MSEETKILKQTDLYEILPFQKTKVLQLLRSGELPVVKVGKDYITTYELINDWIKQHVGDEIFTSKNWKQKELVAIIFMH